MHIRCPHCRNPIEVVDQDLLVEVSCPSCGSSFGLVGDLGHEPAENREDTISYKPDWQKTIGHFQLLEQLGVGAFGSVYKAKDTELDRTVAVKIPRRDQLSPEETEQFFREARAAAQLSHPHIVSVHEVGRLDGTVYIVSDLVEGVSLADWLTGQSLSAREAAELCATIAEALHHAHERGVVHRDLKPANILMDAEGAPHITDFGLAKRDAGEITMTMEGHILGTPAYMAPEQAKGDAHTADRRSDVYSLGVVLFELLTGERPFRGNTRMLLHQVIHDEAPSPRTCVLNIPKDLETICLKCLEKDPAKRFATAQDLANELTRHLRGEPIHSRPIRQTERIWRWAKRNPSVATIGSILAMVLLSLAIGGPLVAAHQGKLRMQAEQQESKANQAADAERKAKQEAVQLAATNAELFEAEQKAKQEAVQLAVKEQKAKEQTEQQLYVSQINRAVGDLEAGRHAQAASVLSAIPLQQRNWETRFLARQAEGTPLTLHPHDGLITSVSFSPDGRRFVSGSYDKTVKVWDAANGEELLTLRGHEGRVNSVAFSPDSRRLVSASEDKTVKVWDAATGQEFLTLRGHEGCVNSVSFRSDGRRIVSGSYDKTVKVWDAATGQELLTLQGHEYDVHSVGFSPDGHRIVSGSGDQLEAGEVKVWDAATGQELFVLRGHRSNVTSVAFSPDGRRIVSGSGDLVGLLSEVKVWDAATGQESLTLRGHKLRVLSVAFSPDSRRIVSASSDKTVKIWDAESGVEILTLRGHNESVFSVAFSPDGRRIISSGLDMTIKVWDAVNGAETLTLRVPEFFVRSVAFSADGRRIVSGGGEIDKPGQVKVWDTESGMELLTLRGHEGTVFSVSFSPNGRRIVSGAGIYSKSGEIKVWDAESGAELLTLHGHDDIVNCVAYSPNGRRIVSGSSDARGKIWDAETGAELLTLSGNEGDVKSVAFSPDSRRIVCGHEFGAIKVWDAESGAEALTLRGHEESVNSVAFSPDGHRIVSGGGVSWISKFKDWIVPDVGDFEVLRVLANEPGEVKVWDADSGAELHTLRGHTDVVSGVAFSPDSRRIVSASLDKTIKIWDAANGQELLALHMQGFVIAGLAFSSDGRRIVSSSVRLDGTKRDGEMKIWDAAAGQEFLALRGHRSHVESVSYSQDDRRIVSEDSEGQKIVWDAATGERLDEPIPEIRKHRMISQDRLVRVVSSGNEVLLVRTNMNPKLWVEDAARRAYWEPMWSAQDADAVEEAKDWFAARFHLRALLKHEDSVLTKQKLPNRETLQQRLNHADEEWAKRSNTPLH